MSRITVTAILAFLTTAAFCWADENQKKQPIPATGCRKADSQAKEKCTTDKGHDSKLDGILDRLGKRTNRLRSYESKIEYLVIQEPELLDSRISRKGRLYYQKERDASRVRVNFQTLKQDDGDEEKESKQFIFDGVWLTKIDYQLEQADSYQRFPEDKPVDVFEYISHNFPMVGFTKTENLRKDFEVKLIDQPSDPNTPVHLHLKVKKDSPYKDDYTAIDFWIDGRSFLPSRVKAISTEGDIYDIKLLDAKVNKKLKTTVFKVAIPKHFSINRHPLEQK
jgi:outer membrane lipoprotein-sorting protein